LEGSSYFLLPQIFRQTRASILLFLQLRTAAWHPG
jgi:hypothetical protein